ncbi:MAG: cellobiohydrolase [Chloroflexi bacterium]|nr:MAG: cellobiohydrolase [Chloroflexota bacterium]
MYLQRLTKSFFIIVILASLLSLSLPGNAAQAQAAGLKVQYRAADTNAGDNQIKPHFNIVNQGGSAVPLSELKIRYWYTREGTAGQSFWCDWSAITGSCSNVTSTFVQVSPARPGADFYLEVGFAAAAGSVAAGGQSGEIQARFAKTDWSNYTETGDYSFDPTKTAFADSMTVTLYRNGTLVWGTEPGGTGETPTPPTPTNTQPTNTPVTVTPTFTPITPTQPGGNNTGWVSPSNQASQSGGDGNGFQTSPTNAFADGGGIATDTNSGNGTSTSCTSTNKDRHAYFSYPLSIPAGSSITGIEVRTDARADSTSGTPRFCVELSWNNGTNWTAMKTGPNLSTTERTDTFGSASDTWGRAWNTNELTSANLRVRIVSVASSTSRDFFLDWLPVRVWYSGGGITNTPTFTPTGVTNTPTFTPTGVTNTPTFTPTNPPQGTHLENPFVGATFYRNVDYVASVNAAANLQGGTLAPLMRQVANYPTFVWLDSIDAVNGTNGYPRSLAGHLDQALAQGANAIGIVVYDLPNRDCSALASNGELLIAQDGMNRYKTEYIDVIYNTVRQAKYSNLRIVMVIEPDSLPNLITNLSFAKCAEANSTGAYVQGVQYAIGTLRQITNTYAYIDVGHHGWLGWPTNFDPFVTMLKQLNTNIPNKIDGFIGNTANTGPVVEPFMTANQMIGSNPVRSLTHWYDWNTYIDEQSYLTGLRNALTSGQNPFPTGIGMLIDTSRNGWGGPNRPTGPSTSTDLTTFVMDSRIDQRLHKGNWCNQDGAGIGLRPTAAPAAGFDAFVWVKPPGESDGSSSLIPTGPDNPGGKGFDRMCDPTYGGNTLNGNSMSGALPGAPVSGRWFQAQFVQLVQNAYPPFQP